MNAIHIQGKAGLYGEVPIQGSKNAVLPVLAATVLIKGSCILHNCPDISDVNCMMKLLQSIGCEVLRKEKDILVDALHISENRLPREQVTGMRSSIILMGALLARTGEVTLDYPGGCVIGDRPIDIHLEVLRALGARIDEKETGLYACASTLTGTRVRLRFPSVGATQNVILAAVLAKGVTILENCAREPEVTELCLFLKKAGAKIAGAGTDCLIIEGVKSLNPVVYEIGADRIAAGTYLLSVAAAGGEAVLLGAPVSYMTEVIKTVQNMGCQVVLEEKNIYISAQNPLVPIPLLDTAVYPGFPTDLQSILLVALSLAAGESVVRENIFNSRFKVAEELNRMGAAIRVHQSQAYIRGNRELTGRSVVAEDLRGGAALVLAGICATGDTFVNNVEYIERGYEDICRDYRLLGGNIGRYCEEEKEISKD